MKLNKLFYELFDIHNYFYASLAALWIIMMLMNVISVKNRFAF
jgi:hypothetical protein